MTRSDRVFIAFMALVSLVATATGGVAAGLHLAQWIRF